MYIQDFYLRKIKCFDEVEPSLPREIGEKPEDEGQMTHRVENDAPDLLYDIVASGDTSSKVMHKHKMTKEDLIGM